MNWTVKVQERKMMAAFLQLPGLPWSTEESAFSLHFFGTDVSRLSQYYNR